MAYIGRQLARGENKLFDDISSSFNGSTTTFNLTVSSVATATATPYQLFVSLGGVMQKPNTDFTTAGNQITFTTAPAAGLSCWIMMQGDTIDQAAIPDASVIPSKISGSNFAFSGDLRLKDSDGSHYVGFASPATVTTNKVWTLPAADGSASQYLQTNGSGVLTWATVSVGGGTGIDFNDSVKTRYGTGNDFEIYFNGTNSILTTVAGAGQFYMSDKHEVRSKSNAGGDRFITANYSTGTDPGVHLWWSDASGGAKKLSTTATGVAVTGALTVSTNATITGDLTVSGTTTTINTQTLDVEDKNVVIGKVSSPSDTTADGGGITLKGATDKTINWVNSTDAWTFSEHINIAAGKKLGVGGANYGTSGHVLTSGGSGAAPSWAAIPAGGNTTDLVADGAIAAGKPVIITTAGKAKAIGLESQAKNNPTFHRHTTITNSRIGSYPQAIWHSTSGKGLMMFRNHSDNPDYLRYAQFTYASSGFTTYSDVNAYGNVTMWNKLIMDPDIDKPVMFWQSDHGGDKKVYSRSVTIDGGGTNVPQASTQGSSMPRDLSLSDGDWDVCYDTNANIFVFVYRDDSDSGKVKVRLGYQSEPASGQHKITWINTDVTIDNDGEWPRCCFDTTNNKVIFAWGEGGGHNVGAAIGTVSNSGSSATISCGSVVTVNTDNPTKGYLVWHPDSAQAGFFYQNSENNQNRFLTLKTSGTTVHYNSSIQVGTENSDEMGAHYDSNSKTIRTSVKGRCMWISSLGTATAGGSSSTAPTLGTGNVSMDQTLGGSVGNYNFPRGFDMPDETLVTGIIFQNEHNSDRITLGSFITTAEVTNATDSNVIGFAEDAINDTATGTIKLTGNVVGNQSSLTPGTAYYVQGNGTLGTSQDNTIGAASGKSKAGVAISSTTLKIADYA